MDYSVAFTADLDGSVSSQWGLVDSKDSVAYILETTKGTKDSSFNPDIPMAFEFMFDKADANFDKQAILDSLDRGVVFHLSPEMIIPEPSSASTSQRCLDRRAPSPQALSRKIFRYHRNK